MVRETSYINAGSTSTAEGAAKGIDLYHFPLHGAGRVVPVKQGEGGHGGGDKIMLEEIFGRATPRPGYGANHRDGALSILTGIAANQSFATGLPVDVRTLVRL